MKYKISVYVDGNGRKLYRPAHKYKFWPFWLTYEEGYDETAIEFLSCEEAKLWLAEKAIEDNKHSRRYHSSILAHEECPKNSIDIMKADYER